MFPYGLRHPVVAVNAPDAARISWMILRKRSRRRNSGTEKPGESYWIPRWRNDCGEKLSDVSLMPKLYGVSWLSSPLVT